jgi:hypothetical protein
VNPTLKWIKEHAKSVAVWVAGVAVTAVMNLVNGVSPWPETGAQWTQYALTSFGLAAAAWLFPNKITQKQLDNDPNVIGGVVVPDLQPVPASTPSPGGYVNPFDQ